MAASTRWVILAITVVAFAQTHVHRLSFAPLIPTFVTDMTLSYTAAGTIQTAYFWTYMAAQIPVGLATDRWGARRVMVTCLGLLAAGSVAFAASATYATAILARMLVGLGASAVWVPGMRLVSEFFPPGERGRAAGTMSAGGGLGGTAGLIVVPWLASLWGWRLAYGALLVPALATCVLVALLLPGGRGGGATSGPRVSVRRVLADRVLWRFNLNVACSYGAYYSFLTFLPAFLVTDLGYTMAQAGVVTGLITAGSMVSWPLTGAISDRLGRRKALFLASQAVSVLVPLVFAWTAPRVAAPALMAVALVAGLGIGGMILPFVMIIELFPREAAATASSITNAACFVGGIALPIVLGRVVDVTGAFTPALLVAAAVQALALAFALGVPDAGPAMTPRVVATR